MENKKNKKAVTLGIIWVVVIAIGALIVLHNNPLEDPDTAQLKKICACLLLGMGATIVTLFYNKLTVLPIELYQNRRLIWRLAKNDFRKRYAGSYLGTIWAMVPPLVTVIMYWFVFDKIFGSGPQLTGRGEAVPYVLFLTSGLVPWFFFSDAVPGGMTSLLEYNYLVKKVVFKVSVLPIIKITAALFVHTGFTALLILIGVFYGYHPTIYTLQIIYYTFCEYIFVLGLTYMTCSVVVFFRDLQQIIGVCLQVGIWATPILWNIHSMSDKIKVLVKINPLTYIVEGYRMSIYGGEWFFEHFYSSTYFWIITVLLFAVSSLIFKRLKPMFADVM